MKPLVIAAALTLFVAPIAVPQQVCPCVPLSFEWVVTPCDTWNCAASAVIMANGDKFVLSMPTGSDDFKWVVIKRVVAGSSVVSSDAPFKLDTFEAMDSAFSRYAIISRDLQPLVVTAPDGKVLLISRSAPEPQKHRSVGH
jgi:hypothetical protein